jgi:2-polyprenyl-3-methyl-5-hydroxy-6-metoxy-1,4-benzoquinol methylase
MSNPTHAQECEPGLPGHLDYYLQHGLNPVRYEMSDRQRHFDRRGSLYRTLGVVPLLFRDARVLEVAPGSGQNSLYVANAGPRELVLVEPNPVGQRDIQSLYNTPGISPIQPRLVASTLQAFNTSDRFDIVLCENWLGHSPAERQLLRKLGTLVAPTGILVVTTISPVGILPNILRKALTCLVDRPEASFAERTDLLTQAFGPHLATIPAMTRTCTDWVHDNVMNPAYLGILLTIPMVLEDLGETFEVLGSSPRFAADWRWFKSLWGNEKDFNPHFLSEYHANLHNFLDYRRVPSPRDPRLNRVLEAAAWAVGKAATTLERSVYHGVGEVSHYRCQVEAAVAAVQDNISDLHAEARAAIAEFLDLFHLDTVTPEQVARMSSFHSLFGRETIYLSLEKNG